MGDLFNRSLQNWDFQSLLHFAGPVLAQQILSEHSGTILQEGIKDKLMFTWAHNGYNMVRQLNPDNTRMISKEECQTWKRIWKCKGITPRVKIFLWKGMHNALPTCAALEKRITSVTPLCKLCNSDTESVVHALFLCSHSRAT